MKVAHLIKVLQELNPDLDILFVQTSGIMAPIRSVQEITYKGFKPEIFVGLCCGDKIESKEMMTNSIYISTHKKQRL